MDWTWPEEVQWVYWYNDAAKKNAKRKAKMETYGCS